jgi:hypothetical protein
MDGLLLRNATLVDCFFLLKALRGKESIGSKEQILETLETMVVGCVTGEVC